MRITVILYKGFDYSNYHIYTPCTDVETDGTVLSFTDCEGRRHQTSAPWEVIWEKPA